MGNFPTTVGKLGKTLLSQFWLSIKVVILLESKKEACDIAWGIIYIQ